MDSFPLGKKWKSGYYFNSIVVECRRYQPWLKKSIEAMGGEIKREKVESMQVICMDVREGMFRTERDVKDVS